MLQLILGTAGTGKTTRLLAALRGRAQQGGRCLYLVPEQFSQTAELLLYDELGDRLSAFAQVVSFRTLCQQIEDSCGGAALPTLTDAGRCVFVRRAVQALGDRVQYYRRHRRSTAFLSGCAQAIGELKTAGVGSGQLAAIAQTAGSEKLKELALIYEAAEAGLAGKAIDPSDRITRAAELLPAGLFAGCWFYLDDFDGFTAPEYALLRRLLPAAEGVTGAFCCDGPFDGQGGLGLFSPVKQTVQRLIRLARAEGVGVETPCLLAENHRAAAAGLQAVGRLLTGAAEGEGPPDPQGVTLDLPENLQQECALIAAGVRALAEQGVRYSEMTVICRRLDSYRAPLAAALARQQVPFFIDQSTTAEYTAPVAFLRAALALARGGLATRPLLALAKTGLCGLGVEGLCALENYAFTWRPNAAAWRAPFTLNPAGLGGSPGPQEEAQLALAEQARGQLLGPVQQFLAGLRGGAASGLQLSRSLWGLMEAFDAPGQMAAAAAGLQQAGQAQEALATWDAAMDLLDEMARLIGGDRVTPGEYDELLVLLVRGSELGRVPRTMDSLLVTAADRMRLSGPRQVFVAGLTEGEFPCQVGASGLLTHADRALLTQAGVQMPGGFENRVLLEQMYLYRALTAPSEGLHLTAPRQAGGLPRVPSAALADLAGRLCPPPLDLAEDAFYAAPAAALEAYAGRFYTDDGASAALAAALAGQPGAAGALALLDRAARPRSFAVEDAAALRRLLGRSLRLSPTRIERFYSCSYAYFLEQVLKLRPRRRAELSPLESGSFVHYLLEQAMRRTGPLFAQQTPEELGALVDELCAAYLAEKIPPALAEGVRFGRLVERISANAKKLLVFLQKEQQQSSFHPAAFELAIGPGQPVAPLTLHTPAGDTVQVVGKVDRVDVMHRQDGDFLRVVDYKTGAKEFSLEAVFCGLDLQMLLYLFSLCGSRQSPFAGATPAGVLYLAADPAPPLMDRQQAAEWQPAYRMDGLLLDDPMVLQAMDRQGQGVFIPVSRTSTGKLRRTKKLASLEKLGRIRQHIEQLVTQMAAQLYSGQLDASPLVEKNSRPCDWCDYRTICCHRDGQRERPLTAPKDLFEGGQGQDG